MIQFERVTFRGINKDISPKALDGGGNRVAINPLVEAENCRFTVGEDGTFEAVQNLRSNLPYSTSLPAGENVVVGSYFDKWNDQFIYFVCNSTGKHGIYAKKADDTTNGFKLLIKENANLDTAEVITTLGFVKDVFVHSIVVIENILYWEYNGTSRAVKFVNETPYEISVKGLVKSIRETSLLKPPPTNAMQPYRANIASGINRVFNNNYQFAKRLVYNDNTVSALSCFSYYTPASYSGNESSLINGSIITNEATNPLVDGDIVNSVKEVQILFRRNDTDTWKIFHKQSPSLSTVSKVFTDSSSYEEVPSSETSQLFDAVPVKINSIASIKNRLFINASEEGFDNDGSTVLTATVAIDATIAATGKKHEELYFKSGGLYNIGIVHYDESLRTDGVESQIEVSLPRPTLANGTTIYGSVSLQRKITVNVTGTAPSWARYYSIARTDNKNQVIYMQVPVKILFYLGEYQSGVTIPSGYRRMGNDKVYKDVNPTLPSEYNYIHFQLPENLPYTPDVGDTVKILNTFAGGNESKILDFDGSVITCGKFDISNWTGVGGANNVCLIEISKKSEVSNEIFYEASSIKPLYQGGVYVGYSPTKLIGDTYSLNDSWKFVNLKTDAVDNMASYDPGSTQISATVESPTSASSQVGNVVVTPTKPSERDLKLMKIERAKALFDGDPKTSVLNVQQKFSIKNYQGAAGSTASENVPDYTKLNQQLGRPILPDTFKRIKRENTIRYSNTYIEDSNINGLSKFDALNQYTLSGDRTPIRRLVAVDNVLLAVHEQNITSMYVGEGFIRQADGTETLTVTESVIGQDRILSGGYGSKNPESITPHMGMCFGWDITKGVVWRYTNAGVYPISDYGMKDYFLRLSRKISFYEGVDWGAAPKGKIKVVTAIDEYNKEVLITFKRVQGSDFMFSPSSGWTDADDQTWAFNYERNIWFPKMPFVPEAYAFNGQLLFSFLNGQMWGHNMGRDKDNLGNGNPYNNFYGVQYARKLRFYMNSQAYKSKVALSLQIAQENLGDEIDAQNVVEVSGYSEYDLVGTTDQQATEMKVADFDKVENVYYGPILKDKNSLVDAGQNPLLHGDDMRDQVFDVTIYNRTNKPAKLYYVNFGFIYSEYGN